MYCMSCKVSFYVDCLVEIMRYKKLKLAADEKAKTDSVAENGSFLAKCIVYHPSLQKSLPETRNIDRNNFEASASDVMDDADNVSQEAENAQSEEASAAGGNPYYALLCSENNCPLIDVDTSLDSVTYLVPEIDGTGLSRTNFAFVSFRLIPIGTGECILPQCSCKQEYSLLQSFFDGSQPFDEALAYVDSHPQFHPCTHSTTLGHALGFGQLLAPTTGEAIRRELLKSVDRATLHRGSRDDTGQVSNGGLGDGGGDESDVDSADGCAEHEFAHDVKVVKCRVSGQRFTAGKRCTRPVRELTCIQ